MPSGAIELYVAFITIVFKIFIYDCAVSSLLCGPFSSCSEQGLLFIAVYGLLIAVASHVVEQQAVQHASLTSHSSWALELRLSSCGTRA